MEKRCVVRHVRPVSGRSLLAGGRQGHWSRRFSALRADTGHNRTPLLAVGQTAQNTTVTYQYDEVGNLTMVTDALSHSTTFVYDNLSRRISATDAAGTTKYEYDGLVARPSASTARYAPYGKVQTCPIAGPDPMPCQHGTVRAVWESSNMSDCRT